MLDDCLFITKYGLSSILLLLTFIGLTNSNMLQYKPFLIHHLMYLISSVFVLRILI